MDRLGYDFFERETLEVARDLLGRRLVRVIDGHRLSGLIVEAEAYIGESDLACHAARGRTPRTEVMYGPAGRAYVYFIYGMYHCLNVVTEKENFPAAVLIRALEPLEGLDIMSRFRPGRKPHELANGPGKLCLALQIDRRLNGIDLVRSTELFLETGSPPRPDCIVASPRIGINIPGQACEVPWRYHIHGNPFVSRNSFKLR